MQRDELRKSHRRVRMACRQLICAVNDNPQVFEGLEFRENFVHIEDRNKHNIQMFGTFALVSVFLTKLLGVFH